MDNNRTLKKLNKERHNLGKRISSLPKGAVRKKAIRGKEYYYLQYRDGNKVRSKYIPASDVDELTKKVEERREAEKRLRELNRVISKYSHVIGQHETYRPVKDVDYDSYTLFMSSVAHDYKRLGLEEFLINYDTSKFRGIQKRYLKGFIDYQTGIKRSNTRKGNDLVLDPYTFLMYFKYGDQSVLRQSLSKAISSFLNYGLLITEVQEAVG